jgi:hypothetical protein
MQVLGAGRLLFAKARQSATSAVRKVNAEVFPESDRIQRLHL